MSACWRLSPALSNSDLVGACCGRGVVGHASLSVVSLMGIVAIGVLVLNVLQSRVHLRRTQNTSALTLRKPVLGALSKSL